MLMRGILIYVGDEGELGLIPHIHMWDCSRCLGIRLHKPLGINHNNPLKYETHNTHSDPRSEIRDPVPRSGSEIRFRDPVPQTDQSHTHKP